MDAHRRSKAMEKVRFFLEIFGNVSSIDTGQVIISIRSDKIMNFIELCRAGKVSIDEIDDFIEAWHVFIHDQELFEFLGMTKEEYANWVNDPEYLKEICNHGFSSN